MPIFEHYNFDTEEVFDNFDAPTLLDAKLHFAKSNRFENWAECKATFDRDEVREKTLNQD